MKVAIYVRVSKSDGSQNVQRQIDDLEKFCSENNWEIVLRVSENISGRKRKREGTEQLINAARSNRIQKVVIHSVHRLGRNQFDMFRTCELLIEAKCSLYVVQDRQETLDSNFNKTQYAIFILPLLAGYAEQWIKDHSFSVKSGLKRAVKNGKKLGRPPGQKIKKEDEILGLLLQGKSLRKIQRTVSVARGTVIAVKKKFAGRLESAKDQQIQF